MAIDPRAPVRPSTGSDWQSSLGSLANNTFSALADLSRRIGSLEAARTVIKADTITGTHIAPGSITASEIVAGNVVASIMTANAVNATHIDAVSIRASILNATSIIAQNLQAQVLTALQAAITNLNSINSNTGTLTADFIKTANSPNARIEIGTAAGGPAGIKGYNASNVLTFGFDIGTGTATVGAISVTGAGTAVPASTLTGFVAGGNLLKNSSFESTDPALPAGMFTLNGVTIAKSATQAFHGGNSLRVTYGSGTDPFAMTDAVANHGIAAGTLRSRPLIVSAWVWVDSTATAFVGGGQDRTVYVTDGTTSTNASTISTLTKGQWNRVSVKFTPGAGASAVQIRFYNPYTNGPVYYDGIQLEIGDAPTAYAPKPDEIVYGSITSLELNATAINGMTITGALFQSSAGAAKVAFDSSGFYVTPDSGTTKDVQVTAAGGLSFLAGTTASPVNQRRAQWLRPGGSTMGEVLSYDLAAGVNASSQAQLWMTARGDSTLASGSAQSGIIARSGTNTKIASVSAVADDLGTSTSLRVLASVSGFTRLVIDGTGASDFLLSAAPTITSGFALNANYVHYNNGLRYWKDVMGYVHILGEINEVGGTPATKTNGTIIFTLPAGYRPATRHSFMVMTNVAPFYQFITVASGGTVAIDFANWAGAYATFGHVSFPTFF